MPPIEEYLKVKDWDSGYFSIKNLLQHLKRKTKSEGSKKVFLAIIYQFCKRNNLSPDEIIEKGSEWLSEKIQEFGDSKSESPRYANGVMNKLATFAKVNGLDVSYESYHVPARYMKISEYIPSSEEIWSMVTSGASLRDQAVILFLYESGIRNSTLRALRWSDLDEELKENKVPLCIKITPELRKRDPYATKGLIPYFTFIHSEVVEALKKYRKERIRLYGEIGKDEPLFIAESKSGRINKIERRNRIITSVTIEWIVKQAARRAGIKQWQDIRPHVLRKAFESALRNARLDVKDQEFLMGHILAGSQDTYYDKTKIDELRNKYAKIEFFPQRFQTEELRKKQIIDTAKMLGYPEDKIKKVEEALAKYKTVDEAMNEIRKLSLESYKVREGAVNSDPKKVIKEDELEHYLAEGWDVHTVLPSGRILIRRLL